MKKNIETKEYSSPLFSEIEDARAKFKKTYTITNVIRVVGSIIAISLVVAAFIISRAIGNDNTFTILIVGGVLAIGVLALVTFLVNKTRTKKIGVYMDTYYTNVNNYLFKDEFEITTDLTKRIAIEEFDRNGLYKDVGECPSRNVSELKNKELSLRTYEISGKAASGKQLVPVFVGKIFELQNDYKGDPIIVYFKAHKKDFALPPTNLDKVEEVEDNAHHTIYTNNKDYKKVLRKSVMDAINLLKTNDILIDGSISIQEGMTFLALGLDDAIMEVPFKESFKEDALMTLKSSMASVMELLKALKGKK